MALNVINDDSLSDSMWVELDSMRSWWTLAWC